VSSNNIFPPIAINEQEAAMNAIK